MHSNPKKLFENPESFSTWAIHTMRSLNRCKKTKFGFDNRNCRFSIDFDHEIRFLVDSNRWLTLRNFYVESVNAKIIHKP